MSPPHAAPPEALRGKGVLVVHGTDDERLGVHYARAARERLAGFPLELAYREIAAGHAITPATLAELSAWLAGRLDATAA